jgi:hypothetical protein
VNHTCPNCGKRRRVLAGTPIICDCFIPLVRYHIDPIRGSDTTGDGSEARPYASFVHAAFVHEIDAAFTIEPKPGSKPPRPVMRRKHSRDRVVRCPICSPCRCSRAP